MTQVENNKRDTSTFGELLYGTELLNCEEGAVASGCGGCGGSGSGSAGCGGSGAGGSGANAK